MVIHGTYWENVLLNEGYDFLISVNISKNIVKRSTVSLRAQIIELGYST